MANKTRRTLGEKMIIIALVLVCLVAFSIWMMGGLYAKYLVGDNASDAARVIKFNELTITETTGNSYKLIPGVNIRKDPVLNFGGSEAACFVFLKVDATGWTTSDGINYVSDNGRVSWSFASTGWSHFVHSVSGKTIYYRITEANTSLSDISLISGDTVTVSENLLNSELRAMETAYPDNLGISFSAYAVQANGFTGFTTEAEAAEAAFDSVTAH